MKSINQNTKIALAEKAKEVLLSRIDSIQNQLDELQMAGANETKSSAGDKYETQGEMLKQSQDILSGQLSRVRSLLYQLNAVSTEVHNTVQEGSLLQLSMGNMWVSIPFEKIEIENTEFQLISTESPLFRALKGKKKGDLLEFRGNKIEIKDLV